MQKTLELRHDLPPVGWLAYCRFVQALRPADTAKTISLSERNVQHASPN